MITSVQPQQETGAPTALVRATARFVGRAVVHLSLLVAVITVGGLGLLHATGHQVMIAISGSMAPHFAAGDAIVMEPATDHNLTVGTVIAFHAPGDPEHLTTHRIVARHPRSDGLFLQTQGDANPAPDPNFVSSTAVVGTMTTTLPRVGRWLALYQSPAGRTTVLGVPLLLVGAAQLRSTWGQLRKRDRRRPGRVRPFAATAAATLVLAVSIVSGITVARAAAATFTARVPHAGNSFSTSSYCGTGTTYSTTVIADTPTIYHRFSESSGTTAANSGTGSDGTYTGGVTLAQPGAIACQSAAESNGVRMDGSTAHVVTSGTKATAGLNTFSLEAWFRTTTGGGKLIGFGNRRSTSSTNFDRHLFLSDAGNLVFGVSPGGAARELLSPATYLDGQWHHVVATLGAASPTNGMRLYVDGTLVASRTDTTAAQSYNGYWRIGWDDIDGWTSKPTNYYYTGNLDEVAVFPTALTAAQVAAHFSARRT